ncbi:phage tail protein [Aerosakkonema sp. BLCC-F183]|uniref:phage tail protein n=1 Tax=Aerosakkonema sp. BLCC-F183 TaxID=3342834 RepID=UPI0035B9C344
MKNKQANQERSYGQYLPESLQNNPVVQGFLLAFENILGNATPQNSQETLTGLEDYIDRLYTYFDPSQTPKEFLPWLASWVALSLRDDWEEDFKRRFIRQIVPFYQLRGTKEGLEAVLKLYLESANIDGKVSITEFEDIPHYFQVELLFSQDTEKHISIAQAIIDQEKPAHTFYSMSFRESDTS